MFFIEFVMVIKIKQYISKYPNTIWNNAMYYQWIMKKSVHLVLRDHPKSYMWDKKKKHIVLCQTPSPWNERQVLSHTSTCIPLICMYHSWFTFIMLNFKYYLGEWYYHRYWLQTHLIHIYMDFGITLVWRPLSSLLQPISFYIPHVTFWTVP